MTFFMGLMLFATVYFFAGLALVIDAIRRFARKTAKPIPAQQQRVGATNYARPTKLTESNAA
jgi:hypothetical protein